MDKTDKVFLIGFGMLIIFVYLIVTMPDTTKCQPITIGDERLVNLENNQAIQEDHIIQLLSAVCRLDGHKDNCIWK